MQPLLAASPDSDKSVFGQGRTGASAGEDLAAIMAKSSPVQFVRQVREETNKVTWPTRKETVITTIMVFIFAAFMGVFFLLVDSIFTFILSTVFGLG